MQHRHLDKRKNTKNNLGFPKIAARLQSRSWPLEEVATAVESHQSGTALVKAAEGNRGDWTQVTLISSQVIKRRSHCTAGQCCHFHMANVAVSMFEFGSFV